MTPLQSLVREQSNEVDNQERVPHGVQVNTFSPDEEDNNSNREISLAQFSAIVANVKDQDCIDVSNSKTKNKRPKKIRHTSLHS